jgi:putative transposase
MSTLDTYLWLGIHLIIYECKYHIVFCPRYRYPIFDGKIGEYAKQQIFHLARQKDMVEVEEINVQADHIHTILSVPPKYPISGMMGILKGKTALNLFHRYERLGKRFWGRHLWSRGYCVSTVGLDEDQIRKYVRWQNHKNKQAEQLGLWQ